MSKPVGVRRPVRVVGDVETLGKDILPADAADIVKSKPQTKAAHWAENNNNNNKTKSTTIAASETTSLESLSLADVGEDMNEIKQTKTKKKSIIIGTDEKNNIIMNNNNNNNNTLEIKSPLPLSSSSSPSSSTPSSPNPSNNNNNNNNNVGAAAPLREGRGLYKPSATTPNNNNRTPVRIGSAAVGKRGINPLSPSGGGNKEMAIGIAPSPSSSSISPSSTADNNNNNNNNNNAPKHQYFDVKKCIDWLSTHLKEQQWEVELSDDDDKRQEFLLLLIKNWKEFDLEDRGYYTLDHIKQYLWVGEGHELDDMPDDNKLSSNIKQKAESIWKNTKWGGDDQESKEEDDDDEEEEEDEEDDEEGEEEEENDAVNEDKLKKKHQEKLSRKRWSKKSVTFWKYCNYLLKQKDYDQLQVTQPTYSWAKPNYPSIP